MRKVTKLLALVLLITMACFSFTGCDKAIPKNKKFDSTGYTQTFFDDFNGTTLDSTKWKINTMKNENPKLDGIRRACYYTKDNVFVNDGNLVIRTNYNSNGSKGKGWYTGWVETSVKTHTDMTTDPNYTGLSQKYGYFEVRCICPPSTGIWSAFWMMPDEGNGMTKNDELGTATDGCEIDIMESPYKFRGKSVNQHVVHLDGYGNTHKKDVSPMFKVQDMYSTYHTYAVEWTPEKLIFYIDGWQTYETSIVVDKHTFNPPNVLEYLILSVEVGGHYDKEGNLYPGIEPDGSKSWAGNPMSNDLSRNYDFIIDYVKVMQKA